MIGLIWFVQIVHYPLFGDIGRNEFSSYEQKYQNLVVFVVGPLMLLELITAVWLLTFRFDGNAIDWLAWTGAGLLLIIWLSTTFLQVPRHNELLMGYNEDSHRWLVVTNWVRTVAWSLRGVITLLLVVRRMP